LIRRGLRRRPRGQALVETSLLLATLVGALAVGGTWLVRTHPRMLRALDAAVRGDYFALSLPFP
jgi:Flp pilus assembly protein TadG